MLKIFSNHLLIEKKKKLLSFFNFKKRGSQLCVPTSTNKKSQL